MKILIEGLSFRYTSERDVLTNINITIDRPGLYCILGPNGVGKSTLVRCMNRLLQPTSGRILVDGRDIREYTIREISDVIGYVPISTANVFSMTVLDTILIGRHNKHRWKTTDEDMIKVNKAMRVFGLEDLAMRNSNELSAGQNQNVSLARGLVQETKILILDEPTANLDVRHQVFVTELFRELSAATGMIVIMISHDLNIASRYADEIILMAEPGTIYKIGPPNEIITPENIEFVYGVKCNIFSDSGRPLVSLGAALSDEEMKKQKERHSNVPSNRSTICGLNSPA